jgi:hypothetical protein
MALGTEWPCPYTDDACQRHCPAAACLKDLDGVEPEDEEDDCG